MRGKGQARMAVPRVRLSTENLGSLPSVQPEQQNFLDILDFEVVDKISPEKHVKNFARKE